jgi:hypothetical protein
MKKTCTGSLKMGMKYERVVVRIITPLDTVLLGIGFTVNGVVNSVSV